MSIYKRIKAERARQDVKWGVQNHPCLDQTLLNREHGCTPQRMTEHYEIPAEGRAKFMCDNSFLIGDGTYAHIALEEFSEVVSEFDDEKRLVEIEQLAAVCIAWGESLERKLKKQSK